MTGSPCKKDGIDCARRHLGCRNDCPDWKKYRLFHALEMDERKKEQERRDTQASSVERMRKKKCERPGRIAHL